MSRLNEALRMFRDFEMKPELLGCLEDHARLLHETGSSERSVRLYAMASACRDGLTYAQSPRRASQRQSTLDAVRVELGEAAYDAAWREGRSCSLATAIDFALAATADSTAANAPVAA
jgi:hypothetical protein